MYLLHLMVIMLVGPVLVAVVVTEPIMRDAWVCVYVN